MRQGAGPFSQASIAVGTAGQDQWRRATEVRDGDALNFSAALTATAPAPIHVMLVLAATDSSGRPREKVSFLRRATAEPGRELRLAKSYPLRSTARWKVSPGSYSLALQINGRRFPAVAFTDSEDVHERLPEGSDSPPDTAEQSRNEQCH
ncbi:hypothetical protein [Streptomyces sp. CA2R106]|uniref:hypothetical protein n=1 Tax=Streptomyces sp. CA2R106 TaxID=3120153 RepID=UPI00300BF693